MDALIGNPLNLLTALAALLASILGPIVTLSVAHRQFKASVLSTNRQKWIDTFRDRLAELLSMMSAAQVMKGSVSGEWRGGAGPAKENPAFADKLEKAYMAVAQVKLLTKASEPQHQALNDAIGSVLERLQDEALWELEMATGIGEITALGRDIIRHEWWRVKKGV